VNIGITGSEGLLGWHLKSFLHGEGVQVKSINRQDYTQLGELVADLDVIVHLAGMNRGEDKEVYQTNIALTQALIEACQKNKTTPHILFSSSTHIDRDTLYGASKRECTKRFQEWSKSGGRFTNVVLPNVYGEGGRPFYNSAVATFCHQLATGEEPKIIQDATVEIIHAQRVAEIFWQAIQSPQDDLRPAGLGLRVSELLSRLEGMAKSYAAHITPDLRDSHDLDLFNTYRSYLYPTHFPVPVALHQDQRGWLFETMKSLNGGQSFVSSTKPGVTRGNHYHRRKYERFFVLSGEAVIRIRKLFSDTVQEFHVTGSSPQYVDIPTLHTHNITNVGNTELLTFFWSHELFDPQAPDTTPELV
jgi:UDP-2-acetamido-2,6-beta-L-arabino-hexul-4-ose reductase